MSTRCRTGSSVIYSATIRCSVAIAFHCFNSSERRVLNIVPEIASGSAPSGSRTAIIWKLEGAGRVGERYVGMVGIRDSYTIANVDTVIEWARDKAIERFGDPGDNNWQLHYTVYGRDGIMGALEPNRDRPAHELCVLVQGVAPNAATAEELTMIGTRQMFYARLPEVKGSAGAVAFALDEVLRASPAYRWTLNHTLACTDPLELFPCHITEAGT